jgi:hypothetical protein
MLSVILPTVGYALGLWRGSVSSRVLPILVILSSVAYAAAIIFAEKRRQTNENDKDDDAA